MLAPPESLRRKSPSRRRLRFDRNGGQKWNWSVPSRQMLMAVQITQKKKKTLNCLVICLQITLVICLQIGAARVSSVVEGLLSAILRSFSLLCFDLVANRPSAYSAKCSSRFFVFILSVTSVLPTENTFFLPRSVLQRNNSVQCYWRYSTVMLVLSAPSTQCPER